MPHFPATADPALWHRFFAIEANNRAWRLIEQRSRSIDEIVELLDAAHTAAAHWNEAGTDLNRARARLLVAEAHAIAGFGESSHRLAAQVADYFSHHEPPDWERAFVHTVHAHAAFAAGDIAMHTSAHAAAVDAIAAIVDDEERAIVLRTFAQVPRPASGGDRVGGGFGGRAGKRLPVDPDRPLPYARKAGKEDEHGRCDLSCPGAAGARRRILLAGGTHGGDRALDARLPVVEGLHRRRWRARVGA
jgi:hypothetical protein